MVIYPNFILTLWALINGSVLVKCQLPVNESSPWHLWLQQPSDRPDLTSKPYVPLPDFSVASVPNITYVILVSWKRSGPQEGKTTQQMLISLMPWLSRENIATFAPQWESAHCPDGGCSKQAECKPFYDCFFRHMSAANEVDPANFINGCLSGNQLPSFQCALEPYGSGSRAPRWEDTDWVGGGQAYPCSATQTSNIESDIWQIDKVDENLRIFREGGSDSDIVYWPSPDPDTNFLEHFGTYMLDNPNLSCSLEKPCDDDFKCLDVGSRSTLQLGVAPPKVFRSTWGFAVAQSFTNINRQLHNQYLSLHGGATLAALKVPNIEDFFPEPKKPPGFLKALQGIGTFFGAVAGFVPGFGAVGGAAGAILPGIGSAIESGLSDSQDLEEKAEETFADDVETIYRLLVQALDETTNKLFKGEKIGTENPTDIGDMISGGKWLDWESITPIPDSERQMKIEIISRGINALWKTYSSNKMWVLFVDLADQAGSIENCRNDLTGPQDSKYCDDGGVYYAYNFIEGDHKGHVDYPWGGDKLYKIDPAMNMTWVTMASARTYQLAKDPALKLDPFNFSMTAGSAESVAALIQKTQPQPGEALDIAGRSPGSWTLPVCNASTWGKRWNWDYTKKKDGGSHPPCICGEGGKETAAWATTAGMQNFDTFRMRCWSELTQNRDFKWPDGIDEVNVGFGESFKRPNYDDPLYWKTGGY